MTERRLGHETGEAHTFYRSAGFARVALLAARSGPVGGLLFASLRALTPLIPAAATALVA